MSSLARSYRSLARSAHARTLSTTSRLQNLSFQPEPQPIPATDALAATAGSPTAVSGEQTSQPSSNAATSGRRLTLAEEQSVREVEEWKVNLRKVREWRRNQGKIRECFVMTMVISLPRRRCRWKKAQTFSRYDTDRELFSFEILRVYRSSYRALCSSQYKSR